MLQARVLPGSTRKLQNLVERAARTSLPGELTPADFQFAAGPAPAAPEAALPTPGPIALEQLKKQLVRQRLARYQGRRRRVARTLGPRRRCTGGWSGSV